MKIGKTLINYDLCEICLTRPKKWLNAVSKGSICRVCDNRMKLEKKRIKEIKPVLIKEIKKCKICKDNFEIQHKKDTECNKCRYWKSIRISNEKWIKRDLTKKPKKDSNAIAYAFFRKKYTVTNNVCRG